MTIRLLGALLFNDDTNELLFSKGADFVGLGADGQLAMYKEFRNLFEEIIDRDLFALPPDDFSPEAPAFETPAPETPAPEADGTPAPEAA